MLYYSTIFYHVLGRYHKHKLGKRYDFKLLNPVALLLIQWFQNVIFRARKYLAAQKCEQKTNPARSRNASHYIQILQISCRYRLAFICFTCPSYNYRTSCGKWNKSYGAAFIRTLSADLIQSILWMPVACTASSVGIVSYWLPCMITVLHHIFSAKIIYVYICIFRISAKFYHIILFHEYAFSLWCSVYRK